MHIFLRNRSFRQLTVNEWISSLGDTIFYLAFINYVSSYSFAPFAIFLISLSETVPQILQIFSGVAADFQKNRVHKYLLILFAKFFLYSVAAMLLTGFDFSILSVILICTINLISDSLGFFAGSMLTPLYLRMINNSMTEAMGFRQATSSLVRMIGNLGGAVLLGLIDISTVAWINVLTFLFAFLGSLFIRKNLQQLEDKLEINKSLSLRSFCQHLKESLKLILNMGKVKILLGILSISQSILMMIEPISTLLLIQKPFIGLATGQSLALLMILSLTTLVFGGLMSGFLSKKIPLRIHISFSLFMEFIILLGFLYSNFFLILLGISGDAFSIGGLSPRLQAMVFELIPEELLGAVQSAVNLICLLVPALISLALVALASVFGTTIVACILAFLLLGAAYLVRRMEKKSS